MKGKRKVHAAVNCVRNNGELLFEAAMCMPKATEVGWRPPGNQVRSHKDEDVTCGHCKAAMRRLAKRREGGG